MEHLNVDDILNASDSDDDDLGEYDVEALLNEDDGDSSDDGELVNAALRGTAAPPMTSHPAAPPPAPVKQHQPQHQHQQHLDDSDSDESVVGGPKGVEETKDGSGQPPQQRPRPPLAASAPAPAPALPGNNGHHAHHHRPSVDSSDGSAGEMDMLEAILKEEEEDEEDSSLAALAMGTRGALGPDGVGGHEEEDEELARLRGESELNLEDIINQALESDEEEGAIGPNGDTVTGSGSYSATDGPMSASAGGGGGGGGGAGSAAGRSAGPGGASSVASGRSGDGRPTSIRRRSFGDGGGIPTQTKVSSLAVKRRLLRNRLQGQSLSLRHREAARSAVSVSADVATGVVCVESLQQMSEKLQHFASSVKSGPGLPTSVAVHSKFIAVGTSRSLVIVFDHFQVVRQILKPTVSGGEALGTVTAIDVSRSSDYVVCGYFNGKVILWDIMEGTPLKVADYHQSPVSAVRFCAESSATVLSVDTSGFVNVLSFSKFFRWGVDCRCLLDGTRVGQIVAVARLGPLLILSSRVATFVVTRTPALKVVHKWDRPDDVPYGVIPCLGFAYAKVHGSAAGSAGIDTLAPVLARGWGPHLQLLQIQGFPVPARDSTADLPAPDASTLRFVVADNMESTSPIVALAWLSGTVLVYMTAEHNVSVLDTVDLTEMETFSVADLGLVYQTFPLPTPASGSGSGRGGGGGGGAGAGGGATSTEALDRAAMRATAPTSFENSFRTCDDSLYLLGTTECRRARLQSWTERVEALVGRSEWLEALAISLDHYESIVARYENRGESPVITPELRDHLERLILTYLRKLRNSASSVLAGVCVEYCVVIDRTDLLFGVIFERFHQEGNADVLLEWLEPYILNDRITHLTPFVMKAFVEHYRSTGDLETVERCLLHMDVTSLDIDSTLRLCLTHGLLAAVLYIHNRGLMDYLTPVDVLLAHVVEWPSSISRGLAPVGTREERRSNGETMMAYIEACLLGHGYPRGDIPRDLADSLVPDLLAFLFAHSPSTLPDPAAGQLLARSRAATGARALAKLPGPYPRIQALALFDTRLLLATVSCLFNNAAADSVSSALSPKMRGGGGGGGDDDEEEDEGGDEESKSDMSPSRSRSSRRGPSLQSMANAIGEAILPFAPPLRDMGGVAPSTRRRRNNRASMAVTDGRFPGVSRSPRGSGVGGGFGGGGGAGGGGDGPPSASATPILGDGSSDAWDALGFNTPPSLKLGASAIRLFTSADVAHYYTFLAAQMSRKGSVLDVDPDLVCRIVVFFAHYSADVMTSTHGRDSESHRRYMEALARQAAAVRLVERCELSSDAVQQLLQVVEANALTRVALVLHRRAGDVGRTIDCYLRDEDDAFRAQVFGFIRESLGAGAGADGADTTGDGHSDGGGGGGGGASDDDMPGASPTARSTLDPEVVRRAKMRIMDRLPRLLKVDQEQTARLVVELFPQEIDTVLGLLGSNPALQFQYLHQIMSNIGKKPEPGSRSGQQTSMAALLARSRAKISPEMNLRYIRLLCEMEPHNVYKYLSSHDLDTSLLVPTLEMIQREFNITDATAYLLERMGNVEGSLELILGSMRQALHDGEYEQVKKMLTVGVQLCKRHSVDDDSSDAQKLWFGLMDTLLQMQKDSRFTAGSSAVPEDLQSVLAESVSHVQDSMRDYVPLNVVLNKILDDHGRSEFREFRKTVLSMLDTLAYEQSILTTANNLMLSDVDSRVRTLHKSKAKAIPAHRVNTCEECKGALTDAAVTAARSGRRRGGHLVVFGCGHSYHRTCLGLGLLTCPRCQQASESARGSPGRRRAPSWRRSSRSFLRSGAGFGFGGGGDGSGDDSDNSADMGDVIVEEGDDTEYLSRLSKAKHRAGAASLNLTAPKPSATEIVCIRRRSPNDRRLPVIRRRGGGGGGGGGTGAGSS